MRKQRQRGFRFDARPCGSIACACHIYSTIHDGVVDNHFVDSRLHHLDEHLHEHHRDVDDNN